MRQLLSFGLAERVLRPAAGLRGQNSPSSAEVGRKMLGVGFLSGDAFPQIGSRAFRGVAAATGRVAGVAARLAAFATSVKLAVFARRADFAGLAAFARSVAFATVVKHCGSQAAATMPVSVKLSVFTRLAASVRLTAFAVVAMFTCLLCLPQTASANGVRLDGTAKIVNVSGNVATIQFPLRWENSWRDSYNWDAVWLFLKYKKGDNWTPLYPDAGGHTFTAADATAYTTLPGQTDGKVAGLFVLRSAAGSGSSSVTCTLKWTLPAGVTKDDFDQNNAFLLVQAVEMVYIPYGAYYLGDGLSTQSLCNTEGKAVLVDSEKAISWSTLAAGGGAFAGRNTDAFTGENRSSSETESLRGNISSGENLSTGTRSATGAPASVSAIFPKGYTGFHLMKYELSQEQYMTFLNNLTRAEQLALLPQLSSLSAGNYLFGDTDSPTNRNGIIVAQKPASAAAIFACNLTSGSDYNQPDDGQNVAANYLSVNELFAYAAWSGLRPMSEAEYEKACRRPYPDVPTGGEYAWNNTTAPVFASGTTENFTGKEKPTGGNVNAGNQLQGPLRCGSFAARFPGQQPSGASYWGVMELCGNVKELCATIKNTGINKDVCGSGVYNLSLWGTSSDGYGYRGGGYTDAVTTLRTSDRSVVGGVGSLSARSEDSGFRCVRALGAGSGITVNAGAIALAGGGTSVCPGESISVNNVTSASVTGMPDMAINYIWYVDGKAQATSAESITLNDMVNNGTSPVTYKIKRKAVCMLGEAETAEVSVSLLPDLNVTLDRNTALIDITGKATPVTASTTVTGVPLTYRWLKDGNELATGATYTPQKAHFSNTPGVYDVVCEVSTGACSAGEVSKTVKVKYVEMSAGSIATNGEVTTICPEVTMLSIQNVTDASVTSGAKITYSWKVDGVVVSGATAADYTYPVPQNNGASPVTHKFIRVATCSDGTVETAEINISVMPMPNFSINPTSVKFATTTNCPTVTATAGVNGVALSYVWKYNVTPLNTNSSYTPKASDFGSTDGTYSVICASSISGCTSSVQKTLNIALTTCGEPLTDPRDKQIYPTVEVGNQCWMAKNLNYGTFTPIIITQSATHANTWTFDDAGVQKWCSGGPGSNISNSNESNCNAYGGIYEWWEMVCNGKCNGNVTPANAQKITLSSESALTSYGVTVVNGKVQGICPADWHIPTDAEWTTLGKNASGWNALLGGCRSYNGYGFYNLGIYGNWWTSTPIGLGNAWTRDLYGSGVDTSFNRFNVLRSYGYGVRCLKN